MGALGCEHFNPWLSALLKLGSFAFVTLALRHALPQVWPVLLPFLGRGLWRAGFLPDRMALVQFPVATWRGRPADGSGQAPGTARRPPAP